MITISIYGSGHVAWSLGRALRDAGVEVRQIIGRSPKPAKELAESLQAEAIAPDGNWREEVDLILLAVADDAIAECAATIPVSRTVLAHTSGRTPLSDLNGYAGKTGVFYPLQSMTRGTPSDFSQVPFLIESDDAEVLALLRKLADHVTNRVEEAGGTGRLALHTAAVLVNNFVNHLNAEARELCETHHIAPDLLDSLISHTAEIALKGTSRAHQTGPALRHDEETLRDHRRLLQDNPNLLAVYNALTASIQNTYETEL